MTQYQKLLNTKRRDLSKQYLHFLLKHQAATMINRKTKMEQIKITVIITEVPALSKTSRDKTLNSSKAKKIKPSQYTRNTNTIRQLKIIQ